jgi:choline kinase
VLLAAGRGRRLASDGPKCLVEIGGKTLLERHIVNMVEAGITELTIVTGYKKEMIEDALAQLRSRGPLPLPIELVYNERFVHGSIVSLQNAADRLLVNGGIWMDADVLYPASLLRRLVQSKHDNALLIDASSDESGEEMMVAFHGGKIIKIARRVGKGWELAGESVGFFKVGPAGAAVMKRILDEEIAGGRLDQEYEAALDRSFGEVTYGFERVDDLSWTEIDFQEDVEKAQRLLASL